MASYDAGTVFLSVVPSFRNVQRLIGAEAKTWGADAGREFQKGFDEKVGKSREPVGPTSSDSRRQGNESGGAFADAFKKRVEAAMRSLPPVKIGPVEAGSVEEKLRELRLDLERLSGKTIGIDLDAGAALVELERVNGELDRLGNESADIQVRADTAAARTQLAAIHAQVNNLDRDDVNIDVDVDAGGAGAAVTGLRGLFDSAGASVNSFSGRLVLLGITGAALAPAIVPAAGAAAAALAAIGTGALIGLGGIATMAIGLMGVVDAVQAMVKVEQEAGQQAAKTAQQQQATAAQVASARRQIEGAEASLANARADAASSSERSAERVRRAQEDVAEAETEAAEDVAEAQRRMEDSRERAADVADRASQQVADALRQQERAEQSLADAQRAGLDAQEALTEARADAQRQIEDLALDVEGGALRERQAVLGIEEARRRLAETTADPEADQLARDQAQLSFDQAVQQLEEVRVRNERLRQERAAADAAGVEGSEAVIAAQERILDSQASVVDAERTVGDAVTEVARVRAQSAADVADAQSALLEATTAVSTAQSEGAARVANAQRAVVDAVLAAGEQQRQSAFSVESAQRSLAGAQAALTAAAVTTGVEGSAAMESLAEKMDALGPAGQSFASFLFGLKPVWDQIKAVAESALLPGLQAGIQALLPHLPAIIDLVGSLAGAMGQLFEMAGKALAGPEWQEFFDFLAAEGAPILLDMGRAFGNIALGFAQLIVAFGPMTGDIIEGLVGMTKAFAEWATGLSESDGFQRFIAYITDNAPLLMDFFESLVGALVNIVESMAPFGPVVLRILTGIADLIAAIPPGVLSAIVLGIVGIVTALSVLGPIMGFVSGIVTAMAGGATLLGAVIAALGGPITLIVLGIVALGAALIAAYQHSETFRDIVDTAFRVIGDVAKWLWEEAIKPAFEGIADLATWLWEEALRPALEAIAGFITDTLIPAITWLWENVVKPAFEGISAVISWAWEHVVKPLFEAWKFYLFDVLGPAISWLWNDIISPAFAGIQTVIEIAWGIIKIVLAAFELYLREVLAPVFTWLWEQVIKPAWGAISGAIQVAWDEVIKPVFEALGSFIETTVAPAFERGVSAIGTAWDKIRELAAIPINFIIETVYTNGIKKVFDKIASVVGADPLPDVQPISIGGGGTPLVRRSGLQMATGGILPGYTPGRDVHRFYSPTAGTLELSGGEPILRPEAGRVLGRGWVDGINSAARAGGTGGVSRFLGGFADGGILGDIGDALGGGAGMVREGIEGALAAAGSFVRGGLRKAAEIALAPIRGSLSVLGDSGLADLLRGLVDRAIDNVLGFAGGKDAEAGTLEGGAFDRSGRWPPPVLGRIASNTAAAVAFVRQAFGLNNIGVLGQRANRSDHPFGKAFDVMIPDWESPAGVAKGNGVASWFVDNPAVFGTKYVIWRQQINSGSGWRGMEDRGGPTANHMDHPHISLLDSGGRLRPGLNTVMNATGQSELVLNPSQEGALAAALRDGGGGRGGEFHWHQEAPIYGVEDLDRHLAQFADEQRWRLRHGELV